MTSQGRGRSEGVELNVSTNSARRIFARLSASQSFTHYTALDGIWRAGNYDYPLQGTLIAGWRVTRRGLFTARYTEHTGAPYTPFLIAQSWQQDRPIYDMGQVNAARGPKYERLDVRYEHTVKLRRTAVKIYGGADNLLDRSNFYQWVMIPDYPDHPPYMLTQMGFYPEGGLTWRF
jgi:hypothetical protein